MNTYLLVKWLHILSAALLFGTGLGIAFFMFLAYLQKNVTTLKHVTKFVILGDWFFTTPAVILQLLTGIWLMEFLHYSYTSLWFILTISLYLLIGACWIPVVFIQYKLHKTVITLAEDAPLPPHFFALMRWWIGLGIPAFLMVLGIYWLMVSKRGMLILF